MIYLDSCALIKLLRAEPESAALADHLADSDAPLVSSELAQVEMHRTLIRAGADEQDHRLVEELLDSLDSIEQLPLAPVLRNGCSAPGSLAAQPGRPSPRDRTPARRRADRIPHLTSASLQPPPTPASWSPLRNDPGSGEVRQLSVASDGNLRLTNSSRILTGGAPAEGRPASGPTLHRQ